MSEQIEKKKDDNRLAKAVGQVCGTVLAACIISIVIALTAKSIMWIIGL